MVVFINVLIQNPDEAVAWQTAHAMGGGTFGSFMGAIATNAMDYDTLTSIISSQVASDILKNIDICF